jgi:hypothetical protein
MDEKFLDTHAIWNGHQWQMPAVARARIKEGVRPRWGGRPVDVVGITDEWVSVLPPGRDAQQIERHYRPSEIEFIDKRGRRVTKEEAKAAYRKETR